MTAKEQPNMIGVSQYPSVGKGLPADDASTNVGSTLNTDRGNNRL